jgi:hypothetical protein
MKIKRSIQIGAAVLALAGFTILSSSCGGSPGMNIREIGPPGKGLVTTDPPIHVNYRR